ncbi:MAG: DUF2271 domain-containing protein [Hyphomonas sp.]|jgi:hypothetical protein|uniref:DUF2271 domain-containing protein n=2 Tax=Hyphomonas sp. TaxID=87 RepID=UPI0032638A4F
MRATITLAGMALLTSPAIAETLDIEIGIPRLDVAEYHRPYVAAWIARPDNSVAANLAVWYQQERRGEDEGETWLKDLRQWWRRTGRQLDLPIDGVSGATRAPGTHTISLDTETSGLKDLEPGDYVLNIEAVREVGGREMVQIPFSWPAATDTPLSVSGETELGDITLNITQDE